MQLNADNNIRDARSKSPTVLAVWSQLVISSAIAAIAGD